MPKEDYVSYSTDQWHVVVVLRKADGGVHELRSPGLRIAKAEEAMDALRPGIYQGAAVNLPRLAVSGGEVISAHIEH
jgi:hypothetical protein